MVTEGKPKLYLPLTCFTPKASCFKKPHSIFHSATSGLQRSQTILILLEASTTHWQTYEQQMKATKNNTPHERKQRTKRKLGATVTRSQENT